MTFTEAAAHVLRLVGKPLHYKEITDVAIEKGLLSHVGKSPEVTMGSRLAAQVKKSAKDNPLARVKPGVFALAEWDEETIEAGLADKTPALERLLKVEKENAEKEKETVAESEDAEATEAPQEIASSPMAAHRELDEGDTSPDEDEQHRAELSAGATELFESEDDDDQPIFGASEPEESSDKESVESEGDRPEGKRRRRRRRGRGRGRKDEEASEESDDMPTYTVSDAAPEDLPEVDDEAPSAPPASGDPEGELADALEAALSKYDRGKGPVSAQNVADALRRRGAVDSMNAGGVLALAQSDNLAAERECRVARFRVVGNKVALSAWSVDRRVADKQRALAKAAEQLKEATVRNLADELKRLSQRAVGELAAVLLSRMGIRGLTPVRRPGAHGSELHLAGTAALGALSIPTAVMVRRDGKDIGRERVTELRGALHHYGPATQGILISTGQVLSGAREEAQTIGASPVVLCGRTELAELCVTYGVGVRTQRIEIPTIDTDLLESLQGR